MDGNTYERVKEDYDKLKDNVVAEKKMYKFVKRTVDIIASIFGIILLVPITIIVCILNFFTKNKGPIFFVQERIGRDGKLFKMYKFRTMVINAEEILNRHIEKKTDIGKEYIKYIKSINLSKKSSTKEFYIVINNEKNNTKNNIEIEEIIKNELNEKYFKIKECLSRCGNSVQEISEKEETIKILFSFLNTRKNLIN
mgnify:CR=1 FL=1